MTTGLGTRLGPRLGRAASRPATASGTRSGGSRPSPARPAARAKPGRAPGRSGLETRVGRFSRELILPGRVEPLAAPGTRRVLRPSGSVVAVGSLVARQYDPSLGRFTTIDPQLAPMLPQQNNGYTYGWNNPGTHADPTGLIPQCPGGGAIPDGDRRNCPDRSAQSDAASPAVTPSPPTPSEAQESMNRTGPHNAAVVAAIAQLTIQYGLAPSGFIDYFRIFGAAKRCMGTDQAEIGCGYGVPDILYQDPSTKLLTVWEVKSGTINGAISLAQSEAAWYAKWLTENGQAAVVGGAFDPISYGPSAGNLVVGPGAGAAIYTQANPPEKRAPEPTPAPAPRGVPAAVPVPSSAPQAVPGPGGLAFNPADGRYVLPAVEAGLGGLLALLFFLVVAPK